MVQKGLTDKFFQPSPNARGREHRKPSDSYGLTQSNLWSVSRALMVAHHAV